MPPLATGLASGICFQIPYQQVGCLATGKSLILLKPLYSPLHQEFWPPGISMGIQRENVCFGWRLTRGFSVSTRFKRMKSHCMRAISSTEVLSCSTCPSVLCPSLPFLFLTLAVGEFEWSATQASSQEAPFTPSIAASPSTCSHHSFTNPY